MQTTTSSKRYEYVSTNCGYPTCNNNIPENSTKHISSQRSPGIRLATTSSKRYEARVISTNCGYPTCKQHPAKRVVPSSYIPSKRTAGIHSTCKQQHPPNATKPVSSQRTAGIRVATTTTTRKRYEASIIQKRHAELGSSQRTAGTHSTCKQQNQPAHATRRLSSRRTAGTRSARHPSAT